MWVEIGAPEGILRYIIEKGSIAIDGISLTVALLTDMSFCVSVIPHTGEETTLLHKKKGDIVNLENDPVGKYVERFLTIPAEKTNDTTQEKGITLEMAGQLDYRAYKEEQYDKLADIIRENLDMKMVYEIIERGGK